MRPRTWVLALLMVAILPGVAPAQQQDPLLRRTSLDPAALEIDRDWVLLEQRPYWRQNFFKRLWGDQVFLFETWIGAEGRQFRFYGPLAVSIVAASRSSDGGVDLHWSRAVHEWASEGRQDFFYDVTRLGDTSTLNGLVIVTYLASRWSGNDRMAKTASLSGEALINAGLYNMILKRTTRRTRPSAGGTGEFFVSEPPPGQFASSFPSRHAMTTFAVAAVVAGEFREKRWVKWVAYGTAGAVALSRVALGGHFLSDVVVGSLLGESLGRMVVFRSDGVERIPTWRRFSPIVDPESGGVGLGFRYSW